MAGPGGQSRSRLYESYKDVACRPNQHEHVQDQPMGFMLIGVQPVICFACRFFSSFRAVKPIFLVQLKTDRPNFSWFSLQKCFLAADEWFESGRRRSLAVTAAGGRQLELESVRQ